MDILVQDYSLTHAAHMVDDDWTAGEMLETTLDDFLSWLRRRISDPRVVRVEMSAHHDEMLLLQFVNEAGVTYAKTAIHSAPDDLAGLKGAVGDTISAKTAASSD